jgi:hypothetical protein
MADLPNMERWAADEIRNGFELQHRFEAIMLDVAFGPVGMTDEGAELMAQQLLANFTLDELRDLLAHMAWYIQGIPPQCEAIGACILLKAGEN